MSNGHNISSDILFGVRIVSNVSKFSWECEKIAESSYKSISIFSSIRVNTKFYKKCMKVWIILKNKFCILCTTVD